MTGNLVYERIPTEAVLADAITVAMHRDAEAKTLAWVKWGPWIGDGVHQHGDFEGPLPAPIALSRAAELAPLYGFERVVVYVDDFDLWHAEWGALVSSGTLQSNDSDAPASDEEDEMFSEDDAALAAQTLDHLRDF